MKRTLTVKQDISMEYLDENLWGGARDLWQDATDNQRETVWDIILDIFGNSSELPRLGDINDFIWFECDEYFETEDDEEDETDEDDVIDSYEDAMKHEDNPLLDSWR